MFLKLINCLMFGRLINNFVVQTPMLNFSHIICFATFRYATMGSIIIASPTVMTMNDGLCMTTKLSR